jgi:RimJ/RimL family protein N-acetyltransferase
MISRHQISEPEHAKWFDRVLASNDSRYWIICAEEEPVGLVCVYGIDWERKFCRWGFYVGELSMRGRGIARAVLPVVLDHAFGELGLEAVLADVLISNERSVAIHRQLGFTQDASPGNGDSDNVVMALRSRDWLTGTRGRDLGASPSWSVSLET